MTEIGNEIVRASAAYRRAFLQVSVDNEIASLSARYGDENAPMGGWRNRAVETIASREGMNPYSLDHLLRGVVPR